MIYYVSAKNEQKGNGTKDNPFKTIGEAAELAAPGDTVIIGDGIYREWVSPKLGGTSDEERITYIAAENAHPVISGAEIIGNWKKDQNNVWFVALDNSFFGEYNSFADEIFGDWYDKFGQTHHTGELYLNGEAMYEAASKQELYKKSSKSDRALRWFAETDSDYTMIYADFGGKNPNEECTEISVRPFCFFPKEEGLNYITVSGITMCQAATQWAPPTAFQPAIIGPHWSRGWIIENCTVHDSKCCGISLGKRRDKTDNIWSIDPSKDGSQTYTEIIFQNIQNGWCKDKVGSHIVRNNHIYNCGQSGIVGCMGAAYSTITGNHIHNINDRKEFGGAEMAGIKLHAAVDAVIEGNCIHNCIRGLWLDWQAQGTLVSRNAFFENITEDLFIEVSHGPCTVENNIMLSKRSFLNVSQGTALVHNLFAGDIKPLRDTNRFTLYHLPHSTMVGGVQHIFSGDDKIANNIFIGNGNSKKTAGTAVYNGYASKRGNSKPSFIQKWRKKINVAENLAGSKSLPVDIHDNVYLNGAKSYESEECARIDKFKAELTVKWEGEHAYLYTDLFNTKADLKVSQITTDILGKSFESNQAYENRDGSRIKIDADFFGERREADTVAGPFASPQSKIKLV